MSQKIIIIILFSFLIIISIGLLLFNEIISESDPFKDGIITTGRLIAIISHFIMSVSLAVIMKKLNYKHYWAAIIPIFNLLALLDFLGYYDTVHVVYLIIPIVNIIFYVLLLVKFLEKIDRHPLKVIFLLIPIVAHFYWLYLAFKVKKVERVYM